MAGIPPGVGPPKFGPVGGPARRPATHSQGDVGQVVPPQKRIKDVTGPRRRWAGPRARQPRPPRASSRGRRMCSACMTAPAARVEERGRAVRGFLDVRRVRRRPGQPISSQIARSPHSQHLQFDRVDGPASSLTPCLVATIESDRVEPRRASRRDEERDCRMIKFKAGRRLAGGRSIVTGSPAMDGQVRPARLRAVRCRQLEAGQRLHGRRGGRHTQIWLKETLAVPVAWLVLGGEGLDQGFRARRRAGRRRAARTKSQR